MLGDIDRETVPAIRRDRQEERLQRRVVGNGCAMPEHVAPRLPLDTNASVVLMLSSSRLANENPGADIR